MSSKVDTVSSVQTQAIRRLRTIRDLMGGTAAMRVARETYLPKEKAETDESYNSRLARSTLFNGLRKTVKDMTGKVFKNPITYGDDVPEQIRGKKIEGTKQFSGGYIEDIDLAGRHVQVFARDVFMDAMQAGVAYILTDMQKAPPPRADGLPVTLKDEQDAGLRPYLVHITVDQVLGWKSERIKGVVTLTQIRFMECATEPDGEFGEREVEQIRVLEPGKWRTFRKNDKNDDWVQYEEGTTKLDRIPIAPVYLNRAGFMTGEPPLEDLADLNVTHWQSQSDQRNILHVARVPILFYAGGKENDSLVIGAGSAIKNSDTAARLEYVEHGGQAIGAGDTDLKNLEFQMQTLGLQLLVKAPGQTATGEVRDDVKENSPLAMMATALEDALEASFGFMARFLNLGDDAGGSVTVNKDFGLALLGNNDLATLLQAVNSGAMSKRTFWSILQGAGMMPGDFDADAEQDRIDNQAPDLGAGIPPGGGMDLNEPDDQAA